MDELESFYLDYNGWSYRYYPNENPDITFLFHPLNRSSHSYVYDLQMWKNLMNLFYLYLLVIIYSLLSDGAYVYINPYTTYAVVKFCFFCEGSPNKKKQKKKEKKGKKKNVKSV